MSEIKKRGGHRAVVVKVVAEVEVLLQEPVINRDMVNAKIIILKQTQSKIEVLDDTIQETLETDDLIRDMEEAAERESKLLEVISKANFCLSKSGEAVYSNSVSSGSLTNIRLPTIELPTFGGAPIEWPSFWDAFSCTVHCRADIAPVQKLAYFTAQLKGEALQLLSGFPVTNESYAEMIALAKNTFGRPQQIITAHLHALFDIPSPSTNVADLRKFRASYECNIRSLKTLNTKIEDAGFVIAALLARKLPGKIRDNINRYTKSNYFELDDFRAAVDLEIEHLQTVQQSSAAVGTVRAGSGSAEGWDESEFKVKKISSNVVTTSNSKAEHYRRNGRFEGATDVNVNKNYCVLCFEAHSVKQCHNYKYANDRIERAKELKLCKRCLKTGHRTQNCSFEGNCFYCDKYHHNSLCLNKFMSPCSPNTAQVTHENEPKITASTAVATNVAGTSVALPIVIVPVITERGVCNLRAMLDQGAQKTFILESAVNKLSLRKFSSINLTVDGFSSKGVPTIYDVVQFDVSTKTGTVTTQAVVVESLPSRVSTPGLGEAVQQLLDAGFELSDKYVGDVVNDITLLIGSDQYYNFVKGMSKYQNLNLLDTNLGWVINGNIRQPASGDNGHVSTVTDVVTVLRVGAETENFEIPLDESLRRLWSLESIGINDNEMTKEEKATLLKFENAISYSDNRYTAKLPWRPGHPPLPSNFYLAKARLKAVQKRLLNENMIHHYDQVIQGQLDNNFIEKVNSKFPHLDEKTHYLPHHGVKKDSATTPLRIVMDCSARLGAGKASLNDCLYTGPSLIHELMQVLLRFRLYDFACVSDISKAFLMIGLDEGDRDYTRFLWLEKPEDPSSRLIVYRFRVVLFGATCSQFLLNATIKYHLNRNPGITASNIDKNLYVDNLQGTFNSEIDIVKFYHDSKKLLLSAGLSLREWDTNSKQLQKLICENNDGVSTKLFPNHSLLKANLLGMYWNTDNDSLGYPSRNVCVEGAITKRSVLKSVASCFDPLGLISPVHIRAKIFIQLLWKAKLSWDEPVVLPEMVYDWTSIQSDLQEALNLSFPRVILTVGQNVQIHAFSDASALAYGASVYIVSNNDSFLLLSKARVAPLKLKSIPRLELLAALLAAKLLKYVKDTYKEEFTQFESHIWSDSQVVLRWIMSQKPLETFVKNRVDEINDLTLGVHWHYVNTKHNPADLLSRGVSYKCFATSNLWRKGPSWLVNRENWPHVEDAFFDNLPNFELNIQNSSMPSVVSAVTVPPKLVNFDAHFIDINRFGSYKSLLNTVVLVFKFVNILYAKFQRSIKDDLDAAEKLVIKQVQLECFFTEYSFLNNKTGKSPNLVKQLNLFLCDDLIRCRGRLEMSDMTYEMKFPILIPSKHSFTELLIRDAHHRRFHCGVNDIVAYLRMQWWIPTIRQRVKAVLQLCVTCKKLQGRHFPTPPEPPLPATRLQESRPFQATGCDYTGAFMVKQGHDMVKVYIALFTCAVTRACHLELVDDNSSEAFIRAFRRFIGRRSTPQLMLSDNSTTFVASASHLQKLQLHPEVVDQLRQSRCKWKFIPSRSPWFGGFWERMIGSVKICLRKMLGKSIITSDELRTLIVEVEAVLNDRPLTYHSDGLDEMQALTPAHLLYGFRLSSLPTPIEYIEDDDTMFLDRPTLTKRQSKCAKILHSFWERWQTGYLASLRERQNSRLSDPTKIPTVGEMVLIYEESSRMFWKMGIVVEIHRGIDGMIRSAKVKTPNGIVTRATKHLYPLEIDTDMKPVKETSKINEVNRVIPVRKVAEKTRVLGYYRVS